MKPDPENATFHLRGGQLLRLSGGAGVRLHCRRGSLWVTQEGVRRDDFLSAGDSLLIVADGLTLAEAIDADGAGLTLENREAPAETAAGARESPRALA